eukprot:1947060-Rhodomonas_salina.1
MHSVLPVPAALFLLTVHSHALWHPALVGACDPRSVRSAKTCAGKTELVPCNCPGLEKVMFL